MKSVLSVAIIVFVVVSGVLAQEGMDASVEFNQKEQQAIEKLADQKLENRVKGVNQLVEMNCKKASAQLVQMMQNDEAFQGRIAAGVALLQLNCTDALDAIKAQSQNDSNKTVRTALGGVAKKLKAQS
jgi:HEAT repeat protein